MTRRVLFVLRGKLGETVVAFATVRAYADAYPGDEVTLRFVWCRWDAMSY